MISAPPGLPTAHGLLSPRIAIATATFLPPKADGNACTWWTFISSIPTAPVSNASPSTEASAAAPNGRRDSKSVVTYCMSAQDTWDHRFGEGDGDNQLFKIDIAGGAIAPVGGRSWCQAASNGVVFGRDRLSSPRQSRARSLLCERQGWSQGQRSAVLPPGRLTERKSSIAATFPSTLDEPVKVWSRNPALRHVQHRMAACVRCQRRAPGGNQDELRRRNHQPVHRRRRQAGTFHSRRRRV